MINLWLFGTTEGFEFRSFGGKLPFDVSESWMKLSSDLDLESAGEVVFVNKRQMSARLVTWVGLYRPIFEVGYKRRGGFYGAGVWLVDVTVDMNILHKFLRDIADRIKSHATVNGQFVSKLSNIEQLSLNRDEATSLASTMQACTSGGLSEDQISKLMLRGWKDTPACLQWLNEDPAAAYFSAAYFVGANATLSQTKNWVCANSDVELQSYLLKRMQSAISALKAGIEELNIGLSRKNAELKEVRSREAKSASEIERLEKLTNTLGRARNLLKDSTYSRIGEIRGGSNATSKSMFAKEPLPAALHLLQSLILVFLPLLLVLLGLKNIDSFKPFFFDWFGTISLFWLLIASLGILVNLLREGHWEDGLSPFFSILSILSCIYFLESYEPNKKALLPVEISPKVMPQNLNNPMGGQNNFIVIPNTPDLPSDPSKGQTLDQPSPQSPLQDAGPPSSITDILTPGVKPVTPPPKPANGNSDPQSGLKKPPPPSGSTSQNPRTPKAAGNPPVSSSGSPNPISEGPN